MPRKCVFVTCDKSIKIVYEKYIVGFIKNLRNNLSNLQKSKPKENLKHKEYNQTHSENIFRTKKPLNKTKT